MATRGGHRIYIPCFILRQIKVATGELEQTPNVQKDPTPAVYWVGLFINFRLKIPFHWAFDAIGQGISKLFLFFYGSYIPQIIRLPCSKVKKNNVFKYSCDVSKENIWLQCFIAHPLIHHTTIFLKKIFLIRGIPNFVKCIPQWNYEKKRTNRS